MEANEYEKGFTQNCCRANMIDLNPENFDNHQIFFFNKSYSSALDSTSILTSGGRILP